MVLEQCIQYNKNLEEKLKAVEIRKNALKSQITRKEIEAANQLTQIEMKIKSLNLQNIFQKIANIYLKKNREWRGE